MLLLAPLLLRAPRLQHPRRARDRRADTAHRARVDVQQQAGEAGLGGFGGRGAFAVAGVVCAGAGWRAVRDPVVHEEGDARVGD